MDNLNVKSIILFIVCISVILHVGGYTAIEYETNEEFLSFFVDVGDETNPQDITSSDNLTGTLDDITNPSGGIIESSLMAAINVIKMLKEFLKMLVNIAAAPLVLFATIPGIPFNIVLLLGVPIFVAYFLAIVYFIRGLN